MGADFVALIPSESTHISYSHVFDIKGRLIGLVDKGLADKWMHINWCNIDLSNQYASQVEAGLKEYAEDEQKELENGVYAFVNHSDCDGEFYDREEMENIVTALRALDEKEGGKDCAIASLIDVFEDAINNDGNVQIW